MSNYRKIIIATCAVLLSLSWSGQLLAQDNVSQLVQRAQEAGIEKQAIAELQQRSQQRGMSEQQLQQILNAAINMAGEDLPADIAIHKALEGLSKGVPGGRIASVVDRVHQSVGEAAKIIDPWMKRPEVRQMMKRSGQPMGDREFRNELAKATSKSVMQNISSESINEVLGQLASESVLSNAGPSDVVAAMGILPDLPTASNRPDQAGNFVVRALKGGFKADELQKLPSAMKMAQQRGQLPAASVIKGVANQMRNDIPAKQILQNLFNGKVGGGPPGDIPGLNKGKGKKGQGNSGNSGGGS